MLKEIRGKAGPVFKIPASAGMILMYLVYALMMFGNDGKLTESEIAGLANNAGLFYRQRIFCQIQSISSTALLIAVLRSVMMGNSSERSYLFTTPNFLIV